MFTIIKRHGWLTSALRLVPVIAIAAAAMIALAPANARAAFNIKNFSCTTTPFGVAVDVSGLGNTNICIEGSVDLNLDCACAASSIIAAVAAVAALRLKKALRVRIWASVDWVFPVGASSRVSGAE